MTWLSEVKINAATQSAILCIVPLSCLLTAAFVLGEQGADPASIPARGVIIAAAAALYGAGHVFRALRLAVLGAQALHLPMRTIVLLHFHTAPVSFVVPLKLGELYRWQQLSWQSGTPVGALVILLLERMLDASILLAVVVGIVMLDGQLPPGSEILTGVLAAAVAFGLVLIAGVPGALETMQAYMLRHHSTPRAMRLLRNVDSLRLLTVGANACLRMNLALLVMLSAAIWSVEIGALALLAGQIDKTAADALLALIGLSVPMLFAGASALPIVKLYTMCALVALALAWPVATALYIARLRRPPRTRRPQASALQGSRASRLHLLPSGRDL